IPGEASGAVQGEVTSGAEAPVFSGSQCRPARPALPKKLLQPRPPRVLKTSSPRINAGFRGSIYDCHPEAVSAAEGPMHLDGPAEISCAPTYANQHPY